MCSRFIHRLMRRKHISQDELENTDLARCLTTLDLTALGVGSTLGAGAYVIAGTVAKTSAGPAVLISFLIAAVASVLAGLCYAEFGARVPKAGSAYIYTYVSVGEFLAFIIGWNLILEYVIGAASVARTFSGYFDDLVGDRIIPWFNQTMPMHVTTLAPYFDLMALGITMVVTVILAVGVKESATFTKIFTSLNLLVLVYICICGAFKDAPHNWFLSQSEVPDPVQYGCTTKSKLELEEATGCCTHSDGCGVGGFAPYGFSGIMSGAATCFFAFVGFDAIATTGEEVQNPSKAIPIAIIASLIVISLVYSGISVTITMMAPYYMLDNQAPFAKIFSDQGWYISKYIVSIGAICALCTSLLGAMFPMPRVVLAMGRDGLVFRFFEKVSSRFKTPILATMVSGSIAAVMAAIFDVKSLVDMMSIGTLLAYTLVSACVLLLRYENRPPKDVLLFSEADYERYESGDETVSLREVGSVKRWYGGPSSPASKIGALLRPSTFSSCATPFSALWVKILTVLLTIFLITFGVTLRFLIHQAFVEKTWWALTLFGVSLAGSLICILIIGLQPQSSYKLPFTVPFVPVFPAASMFFNIYLMLNLDYLTWIRFAVWMLLGFLIYFGYGIWHSSEEAAFKELRNSAVSPDFEAHAGQAGIINGLSPQMGDGESSPRAKKQPRKKHHRNRRDREDEIFYDTQDEFR